jgi:hypothetical protein
LEQVDFVSRQSPPFADGEPLEADRADRDPVQRHDLVLELGQHPADLVLFPFGQDQLEEGGLSLAADDPDPLGADLAVGQPDALGQLGERLRAGQAGDQYMVRLLDPEAGMREAVGQLAVVGQD